MKIIQYYKREIPNTDFKNNVTHDINPLDKAKLFTPMILAIMKENLDVVSYYMMEETEEVWNRKTDPDLWSLKDNTPLHAGGFFIERSKNFDIHKDFPKLNPRNKIFHSFFQYFA